jgi:transcriptional regulator with XRE-family HTH domain
MQLTVESQVYMMKKVRSDSERAEVTLKALIKEKGKTMEQVARDLEVSYGTVFGWTKGAIPGLDNALALARCLGVPLETLCISLGYGAIISTLPGQKDPSERL